MNSLEVYEDFGSESRGVLYSDLKFIDLLAAEGTKYCNSLEIRRQQSGGEGESA